MPASAGAPAGTAGASAGAAGRGGSGGAGAAGSASADDDAGAAGGAGAAGAAAAAGSGGTATSPVGPDCDVDPLASKKPYGSGFYRQFTGLFGCTPPADLALYREMLPAKFEMPAEPLVCFYTIDFKISGVGPYHEAAILLPATYKGESGKYVLTMDLDNAAATSGGRAAGFPKYRGQVALEQHGHDWVATASANGRIDLKATYTGACTKSDEFPWPDFFNLTPIPAGTTSTSAFLPPRTGNVLMVPAEYLVPPAFNSLKGTIKLEIEDALPWNGLIDESKSFEGLVSSFVGGIDLGNRPLD
jgi:Acetoacetate decarboxylase (ADC)